MWFCTTEDAHECNPNLAGEFRRSRCYSRAAPACYSFARTFGRIGAPNVQVFLVARRLDGDVSLSRYPVHLVREKVVHRKPSKRVDKESVGAILLRCSTGIVETWLTRAKQSSELNPFRLAMKSAQDIFPSWLKTWRCA
jgi:hypothetical protein